MLDLLKMHEVWFGAAAVIGACTASLVCHLFAIYVFRQHGYVEPEIDIDLLEAELMMEFAPISVRAK